MTRDTDGAPQQGEGREADARFVARCRRIAGAHPLDVVVGAQNLVLLSDTKAYRFPLQDKDCVRIQELAHRNAVAAGTGVPVAEVLSVQAGSSGFAHLTMTRVAGTSLRDVVASWADDQGTEPDMIALCGTLADLLTRLRRFTPDAWDFVQPDWAGLWQDLVARAEELAGTLPRDQVDEWLTGARTAAHVAQNAPIGLVHGDLASDNVVLDDRHELVAVLDWDGAIVGDPAIDTAALFHLLPEQLRAAMVRDHEWIAADLARFAAYQATWALQSALWHGEQEQRDAPTAVTLTPLDGTGR